MNKIELINAVAEKTGLTKKDSGAILDAVIETITETLKKGDKVQLIGFGAFEVKQRAARTGKNPHSGEAVVIPASRLPVFKAGKALKDCLNK